MKIFAKRMRELRKSLGVNQAEMASRAGISKTSVSQYENMTRTPDIKTLRALAEMFGVTSDYLIGLSDVPNRTTKLPDEIARLTQEQRNVLLNGDDVIIISKSELLERIGRILLE